MSTPGPYQPPPPHEIPEEAKEYIAQMSEKERELHELAVKLLGSSYFTEWSHGYKAYLRSKKQG